jgi:prepilin-type processing-associated H-X9-DG protein
MYVYANQPDDGRGLIHDFVSRKTTQVQKPSRTIMVLEWYTGGAVNNVQFQNGFNWLTGWYGPGDIPKNPDGTYYHGKTMNFIFADGHADKMDPNDAYQTTPSLWNAF